MPLSDIDECFDDSDDCVSNSNCTNTNGSFICQCGFGFVGDGRTTGTGCIGKQQCHSNRALALEDPYYNPMQPDLDPKPHAAGIRAMRLSPYHAAQF